MKIPLPTSLTSVLLEREMLDYDQDAATADLDQAISEEWTS